MPTPNLPDLTHLHNQHQSLSYGYDGDNNRWAGQEIKAGLLKTLPYFYNYDTGQYEVTSGGNVGGGSGGSTDTAVVIYQASNVTYICKAVPGTALSAAAWQIAKLDMTTGIVKQWADGDDKTDNTATDLATVEGHSYS